MQPEKMSNPPFDVVIVGAGPAGATAAWHLAHGMDGAPAKRVALLDKATFPRDKYCGDAWCSLALELLEEMGVLQQLEKEGLIRDCTSGGFISPSGESYVSTGEGPPLEGARCYAIKRQICDERIVRSAVEQGAELYENADFASAKLESDNLWTVTCKDGRVFRATMLVAADGSASQVARALGVVNTPPDAVASRQYIKGGTHNFKSGGILIYPDYILPGYVALFRHYNDDIDIGVYLIPGSRAQAGDIMKICETEVANDPFLRRVLGPSAEPLEKPRAASIRTGGVPKSTAKQFLAVGDAAGQVDPITGEGIHTGMLGGKLAAQRIHEMAAAKDFSEAACAVYHQRWMEAFGKDFPASAMAAKMTDRYPLLMDAANVVAQRKGDAFMADFGATMTGAKPKSTFLRPGVAIPLGLEVVRQFVLQKILKKPSQRAAYEMRAVENNPRPTAFANACLKSVEVASKQKVEKKGKNEAVEQIFRYASKDANARRVMVVYCTEFGFSADSAALLCEALLECDGQPLSMRYVDAENHELIDWSEVDTALLLCSTAGDGEPPQKAKELFEFLQEEKPALAHLRFAVLALGDSSYPQFCGAGVELEKLFKACGAKTFHPLVKVDAEDMAIVNEWIDDMADKLDGEEFWAAMPPQQPEALRARAEAHFQGGVGLPAPSGARPALATLTERRAVADAAAGGKETWHIELEVANGPDSGLAPLSWEPGDALGVLPANPPREVAAVLAQLGSDGSEKIELPRKRGSATLQDALAHHVDIKNLKLDLIHHLSDMASDEETKQRLKTIGSDLKAFAAGNELQDLLATFPQLARKLEPQPLVDHLHALAPRYYSIGSSQKRNGNHVAITVATVRIALPVGNRDGVASTYLNERLAIGDSVGVFVHRNSGFRLPAEGAACVMIGAGTGVAPYRAFLQELAIRANGKGVGMAESAGGREHLLFFGCRHEKADFLYADEWQEWQEQGALKLVSAFSRDQEKKIYVQDRLRENGSLVWQRMELGDHFYICGDATHMAGDVEKALLEIIMLHGNLAEPEARKYLAVMAGSSRYQKDVWA
jgi:geranylgeranyl reductase family protein